MIEIIAYEMQFLGKALRLQKIELIPFLEEYYSEYEKTYNECFYDMRKALDVQPYNFYFNIEQLKDKIKNIYLLIQDNTIIGSVACYGNEIDDLIVNIKYQKNGIGQQLLLWGIEHIREENDAPIILHVAEWNKKALALYKRTGFVITKMEKIR